jgi:hypothetical protein
MKTLATIMIVLGLAMIIIRGFTVQTEKKVLDLGPIQVNKTQNKWIGWPTYAGVIISGIGLFVLLSNKRKSA